MTADWNAFCKERSSNLRERIDSEDRRIHQLEKNTVKLSELSVQMGEILKFHQEQLAEQDKRIESIEKNPRKVTDSIKTAAISASVSGLISYMIAQLL